MSKAKFPEKRNFVWILLLFLSFIIIYCYTFDSKLDLNGDNYGYLSLSKNIVEGHGYSYLENDGMYRPAGHFPPGYPYILAIARFVFGENIILFKIINGLFYFFSVLFFFYIVKYLSKSTFFAFSISTLLIFNSGLLRLSTILMSEIPYLFFTILTIYLLLEFEKNKKYAFYGNKYLFFIASSSIITYYIRSFGVVLVASLIIHWAAKKEWKFLGVYSLSCFFLYLPYYVRNLVFGIKGRYLGVILVDNPWRPESGSVSSIVQFLHKIVTNLNDTIIFGFPRVLFPALNATGESFALTFFGLIILIFMIYGLWNMGKYRILFFSYMILNILVLLLWHTGNGVRYVYPLTCFIMYFSFYGFYLVVTNYLLKSNMVKGRYPCIFFLCLLFFQFPPLKELSYQSKSALHPAYKNYILIAKKIKEMQKSSKKKLLVVCRKGEIFSHYSDSYVCGYAMSLNDKEVISGIINSDADYVVIEQLGYSSTYRYLLPAIQKNSGLFEVVMHIGNPDTYLLRFNKEKAKFFNQ